MTDKEIIEQLKNNDLKGGAQAFRVLYKENYYMVESYVLKNNGTKDDAKDIFQDCLIAFYKNVKKETFELNSKISTYLYGITRNLWLKKLRDNKIVTTPMDEYGDSMDDDTTIAQKIVYTERQKIIGRLLTEAGDKCKDLLNAFYYEKMSIKKIAEALGYSSDQVVKNQKVRCLKKLRSIMNNSNYFSENLQDSF